MAAFFTRVTFDFGVLSTLIRIFLLLIVRGSLTYSAQSDVDCLRAIKGSLEDPLNYINSSWNFDDSSSEGFICKFIGIDCWHPDENRVLNIRLGDMGLKGEFPLGVAGCLSLTGLDLSNNKIYGNIPNNISKLLEYVTSLDLSSNQLSGEIPVNLANCTYLNVLKLDNNKLMGQIPAQIGQLGRMTTFTVTNNQLSGPVPQFKNATIHADSYTNNAGLCGYPLPPCRGSSKKTNSAAIVGAAVGGVTVAALAVSIGMFFYLRKVSRKKKEEDPLGNKWAKGIKDAKGVKVLMFEKSVSKVKFSNLMKATNDFSKENIIGLGRTGTMYKAVLEDGTSLMVKRFQDTHYSDKGFASEMAVLGNVKHRNLVPLLGYCMAKKERLLVYKYMPNGSLHDKLHLVKAGHELMDWPLRLKIGIRAAKGFAWLHHSCNPRIIHRNVSSNCILLDEDYEPKISDFGLARLMNPIDTHLSTFVNGEFGDLGYIAPECARTLLATPKGDVYSFGVVLLELVTGERPTYVAKAPKSFNGNLVEWISELSRTSKLHDAIDESLVGKGYDVELFQFLKVARNCVLPAPKERPTMFEVYQFLRAIGQPHNFTTEDDILLQSDIGDADQLVELIVARGVKEAC
ncbi:putative inactive leucine-rich repeat receptor-like protein kinase [Forsythia ovata]|uniref:Inactive leucine-rich repeat receptor-like protein kinase n=1 Tax=Forsythia ovata TaxID=205694 RepID=A0ABD1T601_9LAMI